MLEKIKKYIINNYPNIIIIILLLGINIFSFNYYCDTIKTGFTKKYGILLFLGFILFQIGLTILANRLIKKKKSLEKIFLYLIIPIGLFYLFLIPLGKIPDEGTHAKRAYDISEGHLITEKHKEKGNQSGSYLYEDITKIFYSKNYHSYKNVLKLKDQKEKSFMRFPSASLYSFVCYIPQSVGILLGKLFHLPLLFQFYLGRLMNFLLWVLLMYYSIKIIPYKKITTLGLCFIPIIIQETVSLSADAITISSSIFLISYILYLKEKKEKIKKKEYIILSITTIVLSLCKIVYIPICFLVLLIPYKKFDSKKDKYIKLGLLILLVVLLNFLWLKISSTYLQESTHAGNPDYQISYILHNPISFLQFCYNSLYQYSFNWLYELFGMRLCLLDVVLSPFYMIIMIITYLYLFLFDNTKKITIQNKLAVGTTSLVTIALIFTSLFVQWTPVNSHTVEGIQGRYFLPILLFIPILCNSNSIQLKKGINTKIICYLLIFINTYALMSIFFGHLR